MHTKEYNNLKKYIQVLDKQVEELTDQIYQLKELVEKTLKGGNN